MVYKCSVCGEGVENDLVTYINHTERHIMDEIKSNHPDWEEKNGVCKRCVEYYRNQLRGLSQRRIKLSTGDRALAGLCPLLIILLTDVWTKV